MHIKTKLGLASGLLVAFVAVAWSANLLPSYAPSQLPPNLAQAPLIYRMAGTADPAQFNPETESLKAISDNADTILDEITALKDRIQEVESGRDGDYLQIAHGAEHILFLTKEGVVYNGTAKMADGTIPGGNVGVSAIAATGYKSRSCYWQSGGSDGNGDMVCSSLSYNPLSLILKDGVVYYTGTGNGYYATVPTKIADNKIPGGNTGIRGISASSVTNDSGGLYASITGTNYAFVLKDGVIYRI